MISTKWKYDNYSFWFNADSNGTSEEQNVIDRISSEKENKDFTKDEPNSSELGKYYEIRQWGVSRTINFSLKWE